MPRAAAIRSPKVRHCVNRFRCIAFLLLLRECRLACANDLHPVYETICRVDVVRANHLKPCSVPEDLSWAVLEPFPFAAAGGGTIRFLTVTECGWRASLAALAARIALAIASRGICANWSGAIRFGTTCRRVIRRALT